MGKNGKKLDIQFYREYMWFFNISDSPEHGVHHHLRSVIIPFFLLIPSLWSHTRQIQDIYSKDFSSEAHIKAMKAMVPFLLLFIMYYFEQYHDNVDSFYYRQWDGKDVWQRVSILKMLLANRLYQFKETGNWNRSLSVSWESQSVPERR